MESLRDMENLAGTQQVGTVSERDDESLEDVPGLLDGPDLDDQFKEMFDYDDIIIEKDSADDEFAADVSHAQSLPHSEGKTSDAVQMVSNEPSQLDNSRTSKASGTAVSLPGQDDELLAQKQPSAGTPKHE